MAASTLALPFTIVEPIEADAVQANFDAIKKQFPLSRKSMSIETPYAIPPADFLNSWMNFDTAVYVAARYWKDALGLVHIEGVVKNGAAAPSTIFVLREGYRPAAPGLMASTISNGAAARLDISSSGNVVWQGGGSNAYISLFIPPFKQEN